MNNLRDSKANRAIIAHAERAFGLEFRGVRHSVDNQTGLHSFTVLTRRAKLCTEHKSMHAARKLMLDALRCLTPTRMARRADNDNAYEVIK